jgi:predicted glycosyltransferase
MSRVITTPPEKYNMSRVITTPPEKYKGSKRLKIIFYCQYVWGMGHLFRSIELVRAFDGHDVVLVAPLCACPDFIWMNNLPL